MNSHGLQVPRCISVLCNGSGAGGLLRIHTSICALGRVYVYNIRDLTIRQILREVPSVPSVTRTLCCSFTAALRGRRITWAPVRQRIRSLRRAPVGKRLTEWIIATVSVC